jgi:membrane protease YdiL (CAAX protease family)
MLGAWLVRLALLPLTDLAADEVAAAKAIADLWRLGVWLALPLAWLLAVERLDPRAAIDQRPGVRVWLGWLAACLATLAARALEVRAGSDWIAIPPVSGAGFFAASVSLLLAALLEEFVCRGLVLKALRARFGFWTANAAAAAFYTAMLAAGWAALAEFDAGTFAYLGASVFLFSLLLGWLVRQTGTVWVAVAAHFLNDFLQGFGFPG